jgi:hypothetical protein
MDKYRQAAIELITAQGTDHEPVACDRYRAILKEVGASEHALKMDNELMIQSAKFFLKALPSHLRD